MVDHQKLYLSIVIINICIPFELLYYYVCIITLVLHNWLECRVCLG